MSCNITWWNIQISFHMSPCFSQTAYSLCGWIRIFFFLTLVDHKQFISYSLESFVDFSFQQPQGYHTPSLVRINSYSTMLCPLNIKFVLGVPQGVACIALIVAMSQCKQLYSAIFAVCLVKLPLRVTHPSL